MQNKYFNFFPPEIAKILNKLLSAERFTFLEKEIAQGIVCPQDFVNEASAIKYPKLTKGDGIFSLTNNEKQAIDWLPEELKKIKPFYTTSELYKYYGNPENELWVLYMQSNANKEINLHPNIKTHLNRYKNIITSDNKPYGLHRARNEDFFLGEKIISLRKCAEPTFTFTDFPCYVSQTYFVIKTSRLNMKYLTGLLNSKLIAFWLKHKGKMQGFNYQIDKRPLLEIPIVKTDKKNHDKMVEMVEQMLELQKQKQTLTNASPHEQTTLNPNHQRTG